MKYFASILFSLKMKKAVVVRDAGVVAEAEVSRPSVPNVQQP
jgi:hypothetical protein